MKETNEQQKSEDTREGISKKRLRRPKEAHQQRS
jgi:hypothetical protein